MGASDEQLADGDRAAANARDEERSGRATLPPPEWTPAAQPDARRAALAPQPLPRRKGARAEEAWLRARVDESRAAGNQKVLQESTAALARWLASRDRDLDEAVELAAASLEVGE